MGFTGKIVSVGKDFLTGRWNVSLSVNEDVTEVYRNLTNCDIDITLKKHKKKRSLDANAYYWVLLTKLAKMVGTSNDELHNKMLRQYGQLERVDGVLVTVMLPDTDITSREVDRASEYHLKPTSSVKMNNDGELFRIYVMLRGSHTYNTEEMARLISGLISECREVGMSDYEIMTPFEKKKLKELYNIE